MNSITLNITDDKYERILEILGEDCVKCEVRDNEPNMTYEGMENVDQSDWFEEKKEECLPDCKGDTHNCLCHEVIENTLEEVEKECEHPPIFVEGGKCKACGKDQPSSSDIGTYE